MQILAPCAGRVIAMTEVADPVFSAQATGPGVGIEPAPGRADVVAPADGLLVSVNPHAFVLLVDGEIGLLVHLGINTVRLDGEGFEVKASKGQSVTAGTPIVAWNPAEISGDDISTTVIIAVMDHPPDSVVSEVIGRDVAAGEVLFTLP